MGEFMTQPIIPLGFGLLLLVTMILIDFVRRLENWQLKKRIGELETRLDKKLSYAFFENYLEYWDSRFDNQNKYVDALVARIDKTKVQVCSLAETVESVSDTLWAIEDDVEALRSPAWKKLLRKLSE